MVLVCLASAKGAPGVTTSAVALATVWPGRVLVAECDPAGGDLHAGYLGGAAEVSRSLLGLAVAARQQGVAEALPGQLLALDRHQRRLVLPGIPDPAQSAGLAGLWDRLAEVLANLGWPAGAGRAEPVDVLADCGRLGHPHAPEPLLARADLVVLVTGSSLPAAHAARRRVNTLRELLAGTPGGPGRLAALVVGERRPFTRAEISRAVGVAVAGVLPHDPKAAGVFSEGAPEPHGFTRSAYLRAARAAAAALRARATTGRQAAAPPAQPVPAMPATGVNEHGRS